MLVSSLQKLSKNSVGGQLDTSTRRLSGPVRAVIRSGLLQASTSESTLWPCLGLKKLGDTAWWSDPWGATGAGAPGCPM